METHAKPEATRSNLTERFWFLRRPTQFVADVAVLSAAFLVAYMPAINIHLGDYYLRAAVTQLANSQLLLRMIS